MPVITCRISANDGPGQYLKDLSSQWWNLQREDRDTDLILVSGENLTRVHQAVLLPLSLFLRNLVPAMSCDCFTPTVILPSVQKDSLSALVELFYTGRSEVGSQTAENEVVELMVILQIGVKDQDEKKKDTVDQNRQSERKTFEKVDWSDQVVIDESIDKVDHSNPANKEVNVSQFLTEVSEQIKNNNVIEGQKLTDLLAKTTRGQKRKIGEIVNETNEDIPKHKKKRVDFSVNLDPVYVPDLTNNNVINTNVDLAQDLVEGYSGANSDQHYIPDPTDFNDIGTTTIDKMDASDAIEEREYENKLNQSIEKAINFVCLFCSKDFAREVHFKKHLSWYHFREEICQQFTGLDCEICRKSFVRKSEYVGHLGSAHKIIDGLMYLLFDDKMAQMREDNQPKALTYVNENNIKDDGNRSIISHVVEEGASVPVSLSAMEADENDETSVAARSDKGKQE